MTIPLGVHIFNVVLQITHLVGVPCLFAPKQVVQIFFPPILIGNFASGLVSSCHALLHHGTKRASVVQLLLAPLELLYCELAAMALPLFLQARKSGPIA